MRIDAGLNDFADFSPLEKGSYSFIIKDPAEIIPVVDEKTDIGGAKFNIKFICEVASGKDAGKKVYLRKSNASKASRYFLKTFLEKVGVPIGQGGAFNSEDILGRQFKADVILRPWTDKTTGEAKTSADLDDKSILAV